MYKQIGLAFVALTNFFMFAASAQPALTETSSLCVSASVAFMNAKDYRTATPALSKCKTGDIIYMPVGDPVTVSLACDFTRTIVTIGNTVVCAAIVPPRDFRQ